MSGHCTFAWRNELTRDSHSGEKELAVGTKPHGGHTQAVLVACTSHCRSTLTVLTLFPTGESSGLTDDVKAVMARTLHPTMLRLLQAYDQHPDDPLPPHSFAYGIHLSRTHLSIFVHFPTYTPARDGTSTLEFRQVLVAQHMISVAPIRNMHDTMFLARWRAMIALMTVVTHSRRLDEDFRTASTCLCGVRGDPYRRVSRGAVRCVIPSIKPL